MNINGQAALVTGGASGLGAQTARELARRGAKVAVLDRNGDGAKAVAAEIGAYGQALGIGGFYGQERNLIDRHRPAAPEGVDRAGDIPRAGQRVNSVISGTWSDGRVQLRTGS